MKNKPNNEERINEKAITGFKYLSLHNYKKDQKNYKKYQKKLLVKKAYR